MAEPPAPTFHGKVFDQSRTPIPGATVTASGPALGLALSTHTGETGEFSLALPPGTYTLRIAADGFQDATESVTTGAGGRGSVDVLLQVAARADMVTVMETMNYQVLQSTTMKTPTPLLDLPQSITVVTQDLMKDLSMQNMADVVRYVPGITMAQGEGHRDAPVIRGNATTADFYVNGVRDDVQYYRDLYNTERVEAVKGANALTFGRGGGGGVINRVTKSATFYPQQEITLQGGAFGNRRVNTDLGHAVNDRVAVRLNAMYENSDSYRRHVNVERWGIAPSLTLKASESTQVRFGYEGFKDRRVVDRGNPSFNGLPAPAPRSRFFGDPEANRARAAVNLGSATLEHQAGRFNIRNHTLAGDYDKFYQNIVPNETNQALTTVRLSGYNNATARRNLFNQTDVTGVVHTGSVRHTLLMGTEFGRQRTGNFRNTAYFNNSTSLIVPFGNPDAPMSAAFRQGASDADNNANTRVNAVYVQDQVELNRYVQVVAGVRYDYFNIDFLNNRNQQRLGRADNMVSPRAGLVLKPMAQLSFYGSYSVAYLPSSGDQFSSLNATLQTLKPEKFSNYEVGTKWDIARYLSFNGAVYRLDRRNTTANDPNNPALIVQTGSQRSKGVELSMNGNMTRRWMVVGGYSYQDAFITSATTSAILGSKVGLVPRHSLSVWNNYHVTPRLGLGLGLVRQAEMYTSFDNKVKLPSFTRTDVAAFYSLTEHLRLQANVENLFDRTYYPTAHSNNNILPGSPLTARVALTARF